MQTPAIRVLSLLSRLLGFQKKTVLRAPNTPYSHKGVDYNEHGEVSTCLFCRIMARQEPGTIVYEDKDFVAFRTLQPSTSTHVLICPREHIKNFRSLSGPSGARLVRSLVTVGQEILGPEENTLANAQYSFHIPPWNSIDHLHLHVIGQRKEMGWKGRLKYWEGTSYCKSANAAIRELEKSTPSETNPP